MGSLSSSAWAIDPSGWLPQATHLPSPNFEARTEAVDLVVLHNISLPPFEYQQQGPQQLFQNALDPSVHPFYAVIQSLRVSSHLLIERSGQVTQLVSFQDQAYHAGVSSFQGRPRCNAFSIGIELEGCDFEPFSAAQYEALVPLLTALCQHYEIKAITGHEDIAPDRKTDPGHFFDWFKLQQAGLPIVRG
ncbi:MAG: 1,6-anhydro-N-acetylmuramyl-L-alanine amidase AmpD [Neisseriaceae bacterium]|nr:1,6-anhydro-N-acetylmuramyl-L-alanine amidase AmpD [Neisseriaceae bacterium]MBP6861976.1 1,6-anhydro-N-acetylmuramyl-L-alanine amidase AmpD [Neisseriaceae bacterium]